MELSSLPFASLVDDGNAIQLAEQLIEILATVVSFNIKEKFFDGG